MTYVFRCPVCSARKEVNRPVANRDRAVWCAHMDGGRVQMVRVVTVPQICTELYADTEGNRWHGSATEKLEFQRKYDPEQLEKNREKQRQQSVVEAQMKGAEVLTVPNCPSLLDTAIASGAVPNR